MSKSGIPASLLPIYFSCLVAAALVACGSDTPAKPDSGGQFDANSIVDASTSDAVSLDAALPDAGTGPDAMPNLAMGFFVSSTGNGENGGNLGGLTGADSKCQALANNAGAGARNWHAYLSTGNMGAGVAVDARDRIGAGPWRNFQGVVIANSVSELHQNGLKVNVIFDQRGDLIPSSEHDILTGTASDGTLSDSSQTCDNWTNGGVNSQAQVGHADIELGNSKESWNSQHSGSCDKDSLAGNLGTGRLYCFAID